MLQRKTPPSVKKRKFFNHVKRFLSNPANIILIVFLVILVFMIFYPLFTLILSTFQVSSITETLFGVKYGDLTGLWWYRMFASDMSSTYFWMPLLNSILMSLLASVIAILYGGVVAFFITRTNMKGKKFISAIFVFPYIMPSWTLATFWQNFWQNPSIGTGTGGMLYNITGLSVPASWVYGLVPCAIVLGLHYAPFAYILIGGILRNMDANLEEAATILKASRAKIIYRITLPIVLPRPRIHLPFGICKLHELVRSAEIHRRRHDGSDNVHEKLPQQRILRARLHHGARHDRARHRDPRGNQYITGKRKSFTTVSGKSGQVSYINLHKANYVVQPY